MARYNKFKKEKRFQVQRRKFDHLFSNFSEPCQAIISAYYADRVVYESHTGQNADTA